MSLRLVAFQSTAAAGRAGDSADIDWLYSSVAPRFGRFGARRRRAFTLVRVRGPRGQCGHFLRELGEVWPNASGESRHV
jgi:hypothetical protein